MVARLAWLAAGMLALMPASIQAFEFKNVRPSYGPLGATRPDTKCLPGDILFISYEIEGMKIDPKKKSASYVTTLEVIDKTGKVIYAKGTPNEMIPHLGGTNIPGDLHIIMGLNQIPGKYQVKLTVQDRHANNETKSFAKEFELLKSEFGFVDVAAPAVAFPGQPYAAAYALVGFGLDNMNNPKATIKMRILDAAGKLISDPPVVNEFPRDLPEDINLKRENFLRMTFPIFPNRAGRFIVEVVAEDKISNRTVTLRYPLTIIDIPALQRGE